MCHPPSPRKVPPDVTVGIHRGAIDVDLRPSAQTSDDFRRHARSGADIRTCPLNDVNPVIQPRHGAGSLSTHSTCEVPAGRVVVEEDPASRTTNAGGDAMLIAIKGARVSADHRPRGIP